jgi:hypothetical protein
MNKAARQLIDHRTKLRIFNPELLHKASEWDVAKDSHRLAL